MGVNHLSFVGVIIEPLRGIIALDGEVSIKCEWRGGNVVVVGGPLTGKFDEPPLEEGRGNSKSDEGWRFLFGDLGICTKLVVESRASWCLDEGVWSEAYV